MAVDRVVAAPQGDDLAVAVDSPVVVDQVVAVLVVVDLVVEVLAVAAPSNPGIPKHLYICRV